MIMTTTQQAILQHGLLRRGFKVFQTVFETQQGLDPSGGYVFRGRIKYSYTIRVITQQPSIKKSGS